MVVAEGYLLELERRGHLQAGAFIPEVVLEHPEVVKALHEEFVHAGSDVVVAFTVRMRFYGVKITFTTMYVTLHVIQRKVPALIVLQIVRRS